ncbi:GntR family transcriptional regulator [Flexivirga caeni]|nr:GntR family transcriptional regulator [Flexivirga caeni]
MSDLPDVHAGPEQPAHSVIEAWLAGLISSARLRPEDKLPPEVELASALGVSRMTLRQALGSLEAAGKLVRRRGRWGGNFIAQPRIDFDLTGLPSFTDQMRRAHLRAGAKVIRTTTCRPSRAVREALQLCRGAQVHTVVRLRSANRSPIAVEESYFPADLFADLLKHRLSGSLYTLLRSQGRAPVSATEVLEPVIAPTEYAHLLDVDQATPVLRVCRTALAGDGKPVEYSEDYFRADRARIMLTARIDN